MPVELQVHLIFITIMIDDLVKTLGIKCETWLSYQKRLLVHSSLCGRNVPHGIICQRCEAVSHADNIFLRIGIPCLFPKK